MTKQKKQSTEAAVREIRRRTRRKFAPEEKGPRTRSTPAENCIKPVGSLRPSVGTAWCIPSAELGHSVALS